MELIGYLVFLGVGFYIGYRTNKPKIQDDIQALMELMPRLNKIKILQKKQPITREEETIEELESTFKNER